MTKSRENRAPQVSAPPSLRADHALVDVLIHKGPSVPEPFAPATRRTHLFAILSNSIVKLSSFAIPCS